MNTTNETTQHTPGEWNTREGHIYSLDTGKTHAYVCYYDADYAEDRANAALIAAAPDLLAALQHAANWGEGFADAAEKPDWLDAARAAIEKATQF